MAPTAIYSHMSSNQTVDAKGPALAIGSLVTAEDGKYQRLISNLEENRKVERQMLDRLVDGGELSIDFRTCYRRY